MWKKKRLASKDSNPTWHASDNRTGPFATSMNHDPMLVAVTYELNDGWRKVKEAAFDRAVVMAKRLAERSRSRWIRSLRTTPRIGVFAATSFEAVPATNCPDRSQRLSAFSLGQALSCAYHTPLKRRGSLQLGNCASRGYGACLTLRAPIMPWAWSGWRDGRFRSNNGIANRKEERGLAGGVMNPASVPTSHHFANPGQGVRCSNSSAKPLAKTSEPPVRPS